MNVLDQDWPELRRLLGLVQEGRLTSAEEQKLRYLIWKTNREAFKMDLGRVLHIGFVLLGLDYMRQDIEQAQAALA